MATSVDNEAFFRFALDRKLLNDADAQRCRQVCEQTGRKAADVVRELGLLTASYAQLAEETLADTVANPEPKPVATISRDTTAGNTPDAPLEQLADESLAGRQLGRYQLVALLGKGAMGVAYRAWDTALEREVALKVIRRQRQDSNEAQARFLREARAVAGMGRHPNIVAVYELGSHADLSYFTMELVVGQPMSQWISRKRPSMREIIGVSLGIAQGLAHAHDHGIIHRDLKPENVLINEEGRPLVGDFGVAREVEADLSLTATGTVLGTPSYMAPEQAAGRSEITPACDMYALGVVLYEALSGSLPFDCDSVMELMIATIQQPPEPLRQRAPEVPREIEAIVMRCLAKLPEQRPPNMKELGHQLQAWLAGQPLTASWLTPPSKAPVEPSVAPPKKRPPSDRVRPSGRYPGVPKRPPAGRRRRLLGAAGGVALGVVAVALIVNKRSLEQGQESPEADRASQAVTIELTDPKNKHWISTAEVVVAGTVTTGKADYIGVTGESVSDDIQLEKQNVPVNEDGTFHDEAELSNRKGEKLPDGEYRLTFLTVPGPPNPPQRTVILDRTKPVLEISSPRDGAIVGSDVILEGSVTDDHLDRLETNDGAEVPVGEDGRFSGKPPLPEQDGHMKLSLTAYDQAGNRTPKYVEIILDRIPPSWKLNEPTDGAMVNTSIVRVQGRVKDDNPKLARIDDQELPLSSNGAFTTEVTLPPGDGAHGLVLEAEDEAGNRSDPWTLRLTVDTTPPVLTLGAGQGAVITSNADFSLRGRVEDRHPPHTITVDLLGISLDEEGRFAESIQLNEGSRTIRIVFRDQAGNEERFSQTITLDTTPPELALDHQIPKELWSKEPGFTLKGRLTETGCQVRVNGEPATVTEQRFEVEVPLEKGMNPIEIVATDQAGHTTSLNGEVHYTKASNKLIPAGTWWNPSKAQLNYARKMRLPLWFENELGMRMVLIPPGKFLMGSSPKEPERDTKDEAQHQVNIRQGFYMQATEVTNRQFHRHHPKHRSTSWLKEYPLDGDSQPVVKVTWNTANEFGPLLGPDSVALTSTSSSSQKRVETRTGSYRLPTEAEWEYACRAGTNAATFRGNDQRRIQDYANVLDVKTKEAWKNATDGSEAKASVEDNYQPILEDDDYRATAPVGSFRPNPWGLLDMLGNAAEWCRDYYSEDYGSLLPDNPTGPSTGTNHVIRLSSFRSRKQTCRAANRTGLEPSKTSSWSGFRLVLELSPRR